MPPSLKRDFSANSNIVLWERFKSEADVVGPITIAHLTEFADFLLVKPYLSALNYLSAAVTYEIDNENVVESVFFERRYSRLRASVTKELQGVLPTKARVLSVRDLVRLPQRDRTKITMPLYLGWRCSSLAEVDSSDVDEVGRRLFIRCTKDKVRQSEGRTVSVFCCCSYETKNVLCATCGPGWSLDAEEDDLVNILKKVDGAATSHSFRRTLAVQVRLHLSDRGMEFEDLPTKFRSRINVHFGWTPKSQMFYRYSADYLQYEQDYRLPIKKLAEFFLS
eukprot:g6901.t1